MFVCFFPQLCFITFLLQPSMPKEQAPSTLPLWAQRLTSVRLVDDMWVVGVASSSSVLHQTLEGHSRSVLCDYIKRWGTETVARAKENMPVVLSDFRIMCVYMYLWLTIFTIQGLLSYLCFFLQPSKQLGTETPHTSTGEPHNVASPENYVWWRSFHHCVLRWPEVRFWHEL